MSKDVTITARISKEMNGQLLRLSEATGRTASSVITEALRTYVSSELEHLEAVREGLRDLEDGNVFEHAEIVADFRRRRRS